MALVFRAPKLNDKIQKKKVGPGYYDSADSLLKQHNNISSPSFNSKTIRDAFQIKKPEQAKVRSQFEKNPNAKQELIQESNIKTNMSPTFKSKVQRFDDPLTKLNKKTLEDIGRVNDFKQHLQKEISNPIPGNVLKAKDKKAIQQILNDKYEYFPSIPDWQKSYGYKVDPQSKKLVSNQNPNVLLLMKQQPIDRQKINCTLGPGYYFVKNLQTAKSLVWKKPSSQNQLPQLSKKPNIEIHSNSPQYNTIEGQLKKIKLQKKNSNIEINSPGMHNSSFIQNSGQVAQQNRKKLLMKKMIKNYGEYISQTQKRQPQKMLQKMMQNKKSLQKSSLDRSNISQSPKHFLAKIERFKQQIKQDSSLQELKQKTQQSQLTLKISHNIKQNYAVGSIRFKPKQKQNVGPGSYNQSISFFQKSKGTIKLNSKRFDISDQNQYLPGPGSYDINRKAKKIDTSIFQQIHQQLKQKKMSLNKPYLKKQDSMESLYQNWGRQMNYLVKQQSRQKQKIQKDGKNNKHTEAGSKDITQTKKILQKSAKMYQIIDQNSINNENESNSYKQILGKGKHLYTYKPIQEGKQAQLGPGKYEISTDFNKKTFNVTYNS